MKSRVLAFGTLTLCSLLLLSQGTQSFAQQTNGPDVIVGELTAPASYGSFNGTAAFAVGTTSCNIGNQSLVWIASTPAHPVIGQNLFRLAGGRLEHIGMSWLKHGFTALQQSACGPCSPNPNGNALGIGCSDPYVATLNGSQSGLGPKYEVNPSTGVFPMPYATGMPTFTNNIDRRLQVLETDINPAFNPGARYFVEGQYIHPVDAQAGFGNNNASWREVSFSGTPGNFTMNLVGPTVRLQAGIYAWPANDTSANIQTLDVPGDGRFIIAWRALPIGGGLAQYEFAVHNLNSDLAAGSVTVNVPCGSTVNSLAFKGISHHSGEPYNSIAWNGTTAPNGAVWQVGQSFAQNPNGNALWWGTMFNFTLVSSAAPTSVTLGMFRPGGPTSATLNLGGGTGGSAEYQVNSFSSSMDIDSIIGTAAAPATVTGAIGSPHTLNLFSFNAGMPWDLGYGVAPLVPRSACALTASDGQVVNIDITDPLAGSWFGLGFTGPNFVNLAIPFNINSAATLSLQSLVISPNQTSGIGLSQPVRLVIQ